MTPRPHDALFKATYEDPRHVGVLYRKAWPAEIANRVDWRSVRPEPGSFVDQELADTHTDLLFSATIDGDLGYLYLLFEHQSRNHYQMPLRVLLSMSRIWARHRKNHPGKPLPHILPLVVSHAPGGWTAPRQFGDLFKPPTEQLEGLSKYAPDFLLVVEDLAHLTNEDIRASALEAFPRLALWVFRDSRDPEKLLSQLDDWIWAFAEAVRAPSGIESVAQVLRYVALVTEDEQYQRFSAIMQAKIPETERASMTMAEQLMQKGRVEGRVEARLSTLLELLTLKFGELPTELQRRLEGAGEERLAEYLRRILSAPSLDAVFAEPS